MKTAIKTLCFLSILCLALSNCKNKDTPIYEGEMNDSIVISKSNKVIENRLDSIGLLEQLGKQKLPDVYDIATWNARKNVRDSILDTQLKSYFSKEDTLSIPQLYQEIDSIGAYYTKVDNIRLLPKDSTKSDSIGFMQYDVYYFDKRKKYLQKSQKNIAFTLQKQPEKLRNQFSFYFYDLKSKEKRPSPVKP